MQFNQPSVSFSGNFLREILQFVLAIINEFYRTSYFLLVEIAKSEGVSGYEYEKE